MSKWLLVAAALLPAAAMAEPKVELSAEVVFASTTGNTIDPPALVAMTAMSLASMSNGRFALGLGVSGPQVIEGWHGLPFDRPVTRMRETVEIVRRAVRGERVAFKGEVYELPRPGGEGKALRSGARPRPDIPIYLGTGNEATVKLTGEIADGWLPLGFVPGSMPEYMGWLQEGFRRAGNGKGLANFEIQGSVHVRVTDNVKVGLAELKPEVALYVGGMGHRDKNFHKDIMVRRGFKPRV